MPEPEPRASSKYRGQRVVFALRAIGKLGEPKFTEILTKVSESGEGHPDATGQETRARLGAEVFFAGDGVSLTAPGVTTRTTAEDFGKRHLDAATPAELANVTDTLTALERAFGQLPQPTAPDQRQV